MKIVNSHSQTLGETAREGRSSSYQAIFMLTSTNSKNLQHLAMYKYGRGTRQVSRLPGEFPGEVPSTSLPTRHSLAGEYGGEKTGGE